MPWAMLATCAYMKNDLCVLSDIWNFQIWLVYRCHNWRRCDPCISLRTPTLDASGDQLYRYNTRYNAYEFINSYPSWKPGYSITARLMVVDRGVIVRAYR